MPALLAVRVDTAAERPLLVCDEETLTYADADRRSADLARGLLARGIGKGAHVGLLMPNGADFVVGWLAAARIGAVTVPLSTFSTAPEIRGLLRSADIEALLAVDAYRGRDFAAVLVEAIDGLALDAPQPLFVPDAPALRLLAFTGDAPPTVAAVSAHGTDPDLLGAAEAGVCPADRMVIVHTSGSTSAPKGVIHQHGPLIRHMDNLNRIRSYTAEEVMFSNSPFFWIGGFAFSLLGTLVAGATLVCSNAREASDVLDVIERTRPTLVNGFAQTVAHLPEDPSFAVRDLGSIRRGNLWPILPPDVAPRDPELRHNMLGMTETGSVCLLSADETDQPEHRRGSFGSPAPGFEAMIVDPEDRHRCEPGEVGELWLRGPFLMEGYYGKEREETFEPDGWYRTGDLFSVDADGLYYFTGRLGDMIKTSGANVSPREVEAAILAVTGLTAHVVGVPDAARGELVAAAVRVPVNGGDLPEEDQLRADLRRQLSAYKVPQRVLFLRDDEVPMLSSGKLDARALKAMFGAD
ncbi:MAG TPA: class I adenylate-forming enzyme family protein [Mycobacteriales bacterium]|nr:class I adenylate-forming enzyme family protein [Mycobacteriales bacterium]